MNAALEKLISLASDSLHPQWWPIAEEAVVEPFGKIGSELLDLLRRKNGFFAFESALHVFPLGSGVGRLTLGKWNDPRTWKAEYGDLLLTPMLFFAQDVFGNQFGINNNEVSIFYSESAEIEPLAKTLAEWGEVILDDWRGLSGYDLAHEWQIKNHPLCEGERLLPKVPFVIGGKYETDNLYSGQVDAAMRFRGNLARQIASVPDGTPINFKIV